MAGDINMKKVFIDDVVGKLMICRIIKCRDKYGCVFVDGEICTVDTIERVGMLF